MDLIGLVRRDGVDKLCWKASSWEIFEVRFYYRLMWGIWREGNAPYFLRK